MRIGINRVVIVLAGFGVLTESCVQAQAQTPTQNRSVVIQSGTSYHDDVSPALREIAPGWPAARKGDDRTIALSPVIPSNRIDRSDLIIQDGFTASSIPSPILDFDGMRFGAGGSSVPPDTDGAVGMTQYVQVVKQAYQVFDKSTGVSVLGPANISSIWSGAGGVCQNSGTGNPAVLYDHMANRWLISQFAGTSAPTDECVAISTTSDATGTWKRYAFHLGANLFDSPHFGVWLDGYYMSVNVFNSSGTAFLGPQAFAFDRTAMLAGAPATFVTPGITGGASEPSFLPSDLDGAMTPPAGTGNPFVSFPGAGTYTFRLFHADFVTPGNTTFDLIGSPAAAGFTPLCPGTVVCVPQPGTAAQLDGLGGRLMVRLAYRKFADHESVVGNYAVSANGVAGIRWFELRNVTDGPVTVYQESTYQPDTTWRWTGSGAMDQAGNFALGFSASSSTVYPSIRYTGRLVGDPLNTLPQGEAALIAGSGSQTGSSGWGRSSSMSIDPMDDCTFWYTNEYYETTSANNWRTRIGNFKFKECTSGPTPTPTPPAPSPTPTSTPTPTPLPCSSPVLGYRPEHFDNVVPPALPPGWTATSAAGATLWTTSNAGDPLPPADTTPNAAFIDDPDAVSDQRLDSPSIDVFGTDTRLTFRHNFNFQDGFDGGVLEISIHDGPFQDVITAGGGFLLGGYNATISAIGGGPIASRQAWSGNSHGFITTIVRLPSNTDFSTFRLRWRMGSDATVSGQGWRVDTVSFMYCPKPIPSTPTPGPTTPPPTPTATATPTPSPTPTANPTPTPTASPSPTATPFPAAVHALNISTRLRVEPGDRVAIGGFIITGIEPKKVAIRGIGPSLGNSGLGDVLADPTLELRDASGVLLLQNDNWQDDPAQAAQLTTLGLGLPDPRESGIVITLDPGACTAILAGKNQTTGVGLIEIYDADPAVASQLANISTRGLVQAGDNVMIGGFILGQGNASAAVAVRGIGPSLSQAGLTDVLPDPTLELHDGNGALLVANDNWQDDAVSAAQLAGHGLAPANSLESGIFATLPPGLFTAILAGKNGGVGLGLVEIYSGLDGNTLTVTSTADSGPGSLRDAIVVVGDGGTIQFDPALNGQTITLTSSELLIDKSITIRGPAIVQRSTADGTPAFRIFHVTPGHTVTMHGLTISNGFANMNNPSGGGVFNDQSTLTLNYCAVEYNHSAVGSGGGIYNSGSSAILTVVHSTVTGNFMEVEPVFICCGGGFGAGICSTGTLAIDHSTVRGNRTGYIQNNFSGDGGGIYVSGGAVTISNSSVSGNFANRVAGGIFNQGTLEITNSTILYNQAIFAGGGIYNGGTLAIDNSTFTGNTTDTLPPQGQGGGIKNTSSATIIRTTFSGNRADGDGGGIFNSGAIQIGNTILKADSTGGGNIFSQGASTVTSLGYNLSSDNGGGFLTATGDQINTNPMLGPLQDNGGPTFTHALLFGSPAIDAGDPNFAPPPSFDQRGPGYPRVIGGRIDIGSFEVQETARTPGTRR